MILVVMYAIAPSQTGLTCIRLTQGKIFIAHYYAHNTHQDVGYKLG